MYKNHKNKKTSWEKKIFVIIPTFLHDWSLFWGYFYSHYSKCWQQARCCCREVLIMSLCCQWKDSSCGTVQNMFPLFNSCCWLLIFGSFVSVVDAAWCTFHFDPQNSTFFFPASTFRFTAWQKEKVDDLCGRVYFGATYCFSLWLVFLI